MTEHQMEFLSLGGCTGLSKSTLVTMPHCLKSHVAAKTMMMHINQCIKNMPTSNSVDNRFETITTYIVFRGAVTLSYLSKTTNWNGNREY